MTTIQFYHLTSTPLERALPKLLEKALSGGFKAQVVAADETRVERLNELLWTYEEGSFLPHGSLKDGHTEQQPVLLLSTNELQQLNDKPLWNALFITDGSSPANIEHYERILDIFDGRNENEVTLARARWKTYKDAGHALTYLRQSEQGSWEKAA